MDASTPLPPHSESRTSVTPTRSAQGPAAKQNAPRESSPHRVRSLWISDVHLGTKGCQAEVLLQFLKQYDCERLYLVGDIIDGWRLRSRIFWPQHHTDVIRRVLTKAKRGCEVIVVTGNHDEFLRRYTDVEMGNVTICDEAEHQRVNGEKLLIIHGDQYDGIVTGHRWLAFLGDKGYAFLLVLNRWVNRFRERFNYPYWSLSAHVKHKVKRAVNFIYDFEHAVAWDCRRRGFAGVVCGHIHHAEIRDIDGITYYNAGDWVESCTALIEHHDGRIELCHWLTADAPRKEEPAVENA